MYHGIYTSRFQKVLPRGLRVVPRRQGGRRVPRLLVGWASHALHKTEFAVEIACSSILDEKSQKEGNLDKEREQKGVHTHTLNRKCLSRRQIDTDFTGYCKYINLKSNDQKLMATLSLFSNKKKSMCMRMYICVFWENTVNQGRKINLITNK